MPPQPSPREGVLEGEVMPLLQWTCHPKLRLGSWAWAREVLSFLSALRINLA